MSPQQQTFAFLEEPAVSPVIATVAAPAPDAAVGPPFQDKPIPETDVNTPSQREHLLADLRRRAAGISGGAPGQTTDVFSTGCGVLDTWLPHRGLPRAALCEWISATSGGAAGTLAMIAAANACKADAARRPLVVIDPAGTFYLPAAIALGVDASQIIWCRVRDRRDAVWAMDQALRSAAVGAVWALVPWPLDDRDARRLQLAAEAGRTPGLLIREATQRSCPSFAAVRWHVAPHPVTSPRDASRDRDASQNRDVRVAAVTLDRAVGGVVRRRRGLLAIDDQANLQVLDSHHDSAAMPLAARLADPTSTRRAGKTSVGKSTGDRRRAG